MPHLFFSGRPRPTRALPSSEQTTYSWGYALPDIMPLSETSDFRYHMWQTIALVLLGLGSWDAYDRAMRVAKRRTAWWTVFSWTS